MLLRSICGSLPCFADNKHPINTMPLEVQVLQNMSSQNTGAITIKLIGSLDTATPEHGHLGTDAIARAESQKEVAEWLAR